MKIGKFSIDIITQKLITSKKLIKNKFKGHVIFEKYNPILKWGGFVAESPENYSYVYGVDTALSISSSNVTIIGYQKDSAGGYDISGGKKPNFFQKNIINILLGWKYVELDKI